MHNSTNPQLVFIPLKEKYQSSKLTELIEYIIPHEQKVVVEKKDNSLLGFYFILDKKIDYKEGCFHLSINSRLEDLLISYERDKKFVKFIDASAPCPHEDFKNFTFQLAEHLPITYTPEKLLFLLNNFKNDFNTTLVEEYPELLGAVSYSIYCQQENRDEEIAPALLTAFSAHIRHNSYAQLLYISSHLYFLEELAKRKQLFTSDKDPFGSKSIIDVLVDIFLDIKVPHLPPMPEELLHLFYKRIEKYFLQKSFQYSNKIYYKNLPLGAIEKLLIFLEINYTKLQKLLQRTKFFLKSLPKDKDNPHKVLPIPIEEQIPYIEHILETISIKDNTEYLYVFEDFVQSIKNIIIIE